MFSTSKLHLCPKFISYQIRIRPQLKWFLFPKYFDNLTHVRNIITIIISVRKMYPQLVRSLGYHAFVLSDLAGSGGGIASGQYIKRI